MSVSLSLVSAAPARRAQRRPPTGLHPAGTRRVPFDLADIAVGLAATAENVYLDGGDTTRRHARVLSTDRYDAWVIRWATAAELRLHDHGGSAGVVHVVDGELLELRANPPLPRMRARTVHIGETMRIGPGTIHAISNIAVTEALSVHVYSPPLSRMTFYDDRNGVLVPAETSLVARDNAPA